MAGQISPRTETWLHDAIKRVLRFYHPACIDDVHGGYIAQFDEVTGEVYDREQKHLVAQCRFVANYAVADMVGGPVWCRSAATHGLSFLLDHQQDHDRGGFDWVLHGTDPVERRRVCYGHAFVLLALARAVEADIGNHTSDLVAVADLIDDRFWEPTVGLCKSAYTPDWSRAEEYRGQNANMHMCEALIAAYEATGEERYLDRARTIAKTITVELAGGTEGRIWEHYTADWTPDFSYNRDNPEDRFRPWGYQPGHHVEWAKLLAVLARHAEAQWLLPRARELFEEAITMGWDEERGGFHYTVDPDGEPIVSDKYGWAVAEGIGAAAALFEQTCEDPYREWYGRFWNYAASNLVNADHGNWYTKVTASNDPVPTTTGIAVEPGYHPIGACIEGLTAFGSE